MPISYTCRACGCAVTDADLRSGRAAHSGRDLYCAECAALLTEPADNVAIQTPPAPVLVQTPLPRRPPPVPQPPPAPVLQLPGLDEEYQDDQPLPETPPAEEEEEQGAEEEFEESRRPSRGRMGRGVGARRASAAPPVRPASSRAPPARASGGAGLGARRQASGRRPPPAAEPARPAPRPSGRRPSAQPPPAPEPEPRAEPPPEPDSRASGRRRDSKRLAAPSGRAASRAEADDRSAPRSRREESQAASRGGVGAVAKNPVVLILIIAGGAIVIGLAALFASGSSSPAKKGGAKTEAGSLAPEEYVKRAQAAEAKGSKMQARDCWLKAAEGFENKGMSKEAEKANCEAVRLRLGMTLNDTK